MTFLDPTRAELSRHEAGHAYAYAALNRGGEPEELGLAKAENGWRGWCLRRTMLHREVGAISDQASNVRPSGASRARFSHAPQSLANGSNR